MKLRTFAAGTVFVASAALAPGCAPKLSEDPNDMEQVFDTAVSTQRKDDGSFDTVIAAIDSQVWIYFSFDTGKEAFVVDPLKSREWDLRFSRFNIRINSGISGEGTVELAVLETADYAMVARAPSSEYITDKTDTDNDGRENLAFREANAASENGWFAYDGQFHTVTPADVAYVVHAENHTYYKLQFLGYYDEHGEPGFPHFRWAPIAMP